AAKRLGMSLRTVQLWVESGTLPAWKTAGGHRRIARDAVERLVREQDRALEPGSRESQFRILVVEDEESLRKLYEAKLAGWDLPLEILTTSNGYEALLIIGEKRPDLLVADLSMPAMDGFRMIRTLKSSDDYRNLEIVVVTALDTTEIVDRGGLPENVRVFRKPIPFADLEAIVRDRFARAADDS
ncbi:MAG: response regulator, partial [Gammaproteobacteria bacterium]|nr:response regulator [Gammaproteobacteria bacterium]